MWLNWHTIFPSSSFIVYHLCLPLYIVYYHCLPTPNSLILWNSKNVCSIHSWWKCMLNQGSPWVICLETYTGWVHLWLNSHTIFPSCSFEVYHLCPPLYIVYCHCLPTPNSVVHRNSRNVCSIHSCWKYMLKTKVVLESYALKHIQRMVSHVNEFSYYISFLFFYSLSSLSSIVYCVLPLSPYS